MTHKIFFILMGLFSINTMAQEIFIASFLEKWENSQTYLTEVARVMPEDKYDYRPTPQQMSFREQLEHIQDNIDWLRSAYIATENLEEEVSINQNSKERLIANLKSSFRNLAHQLKSLASEDLKTEVDFFAGKKTKMQILNLMQDHITHHRGQLVVYLNLNQIAPPKYVGW